MSKRAAFDDITNQRLDNTTIKNIVLAKPPESKGTGKGVDTRVSKTDLAPRHRGPRRPGPGAGHQHPWVNIDCDLNDVGCCAEYAEEIYENLRLSERRRRPGTTYMESVQTDINPAMRSILVDWLVEVGLEYRLSSDTLFMSVALIDRFLSLSDIRRNRLQLVGITAMLVSSKYEEIYAPQVDEFCFITDSTYTRDEVLSMEKELLKLLEFDLTQPTTKTFLRRYIKAASAEISLDVVFEFLVSYLAELSLMDYNLLKFLPSHIAASCILLGLFLLGKPRWSGTLSHYTSYMPKELKQCVQMIHNLFVSAKTSALPASREKYASSKYGSVSLLRAPETLPDWLFQ
ncbi:hypothetical protein M9435_004849 [Picochlorum sp. BPE23]|nr:hypothetical protein M9435_004849 [Picochlorum sp. BPE23]